MTAAPVRRTVATALASLALVAGGCTSATDEADDSASTAGAAPTPDAPTPDAPTSAASPTPPTATATPTPPPGATSEPTPDDTTSSTPPPVAVPSPGPSASPSIDCTDDERAAMEAVVRDQLEAFSAGDFAAARDLASETFRGGVDLDDFEVLITEEYPVVLADTDPAFGRCAATNPGGLLEVAVSGPDGIAELVYLLVREDGRWAIEAAQYTTPPGDDGVVT